MIPQFRFTIYSPVIPGPPKVLTRDPGGWKEGKLVLKRWENHDVIETFEGDFIFTGDDGIRDGGVDYIREAITEGGPNVIITITVEVSFDGFTYQECFFGKLDVSLKEERVGESWNEIKMPVIRDDFWSTFKSNLDLKVDLKSASTFNGTAITPEPHHYFQLGSQKIVKRYEGYQALPPHPSFGFSWFLDDYFQFDVDTDTIKELKKYSYPWSENPDRPVWLFEIEEPGTYTWDIRVKLRIVTESELDRSSWVEMVLQKNDDTPIVIPHDPMEPFQYYRYAYTSSGNNYNKGDVFRIYLRKVSSFSEALFISCEVGQFVTPGGSLDYQTRFRLEGATTYVNTLAEGFRIFDALNSVVSRISNTPDSLKSDFFETGFGRRYALIRGLQIRQYTLAEKPFFATLKDLYAGADAIFCLGMGYDVIDGDPKIVIEGREFFYDKSSTSVDIGGLPLLVHTFDLQKFYKQVKIGYRKWQSEGTGGLNDPQTVRHYRTMFSNFGVDIDLMSNFIAASTAWETCRRFTKEKNADYKHDEDVFILSLQYSGGSPNQLDPEYDENFTGITNIENPSFRYNHRLTSARNMNRQLKWLSGCLKYYPGDAFLFNSGEGNFDMTSTLNDGTPEAGDGTNLSEKENIVADADPILLPEKTTIEADQNVALPWENYVTIRNNRRKAIGLSLDYENFTKYFINELGFTISTEIMTLDAQKAE